MLSASFYLAHLRYFRYSCLIFHPPSSILPLTPSPKQTKSRFLAISALIVRRETPLALYKGLDAILPGIVPKMTIRFTSSERYKV